MMTAFLTLGYLMRNLIIGGSLLALTLLTGCSQKIAKPTEYGSFLSNYDDLTVIEADSGRKALRWVNPDVKLSQYGQIIYTPIQYHPLPTKSEQITKGTLKNILNYTNKQVELALHKQEAKIQTQANKHKALIFQGAITRVDLKAESFQPYEVLPVMAIVSGAEYAMGGRDIRSSIFFEAEFVDSDSLKPVVRVIMRANGETLSNKETKLTLKDVKEAIDLLATDIASFQPVS